MRETERDRETETERQREKQRQRQRQTDTERDRRRVAHADGNCHLVFVKNTTRAGDNVSTTSVRNIHN